MTASIRWMARVASDLATLTPTFAGFATMPVTNLQNPRRGRVFRHNLVGSPSGNTIIGTWNGDSYFASVVGLDRVNFSSAATWRFRGYSSVTDASGAADVDTGTQSAYNASALGPFTWGQTATGVAVQDGYLGFKYAVLYFPRTLLKSFRIDYLDGANPDGYNEIERLVLGDYTELTRNAQWGIKFTWREATTQEMSDGGSTFSDGRLPTRVLTGKIPGLTPAERTLMADFIRFVGKRKSFFVSAQPDEGANLQRDLTFLQAKFTQVPELSWILPDAHELPFEIVEA